MSEQPKPQDGPPSVAGVAGAEPGAGQGVGADKPKGALAGEGAGAGEPADGGSSSPSGQGWLPPQLERAASVLLELFDGPVLTALLLLLLTGTISLQWLNRRIDRALNPGAAAAVWDTGQTADVQLTLITADARRLQCATDTQLGDLHCTHTAKKKAWPKSNEAPLDDNGARVIRPYRTADTNKLILVAGVWAQPELAFRVHREPPGSFADDKLPRFTAYCRVRFEGKLQDVKLRWRTTGAWQDTKEAQVARVEHCTLQPPGD